MQKQSLQVFKAQLFKALAHPTRIRILECLRSGELTVSELQTRLQIESSSMSQQLSVLRSHQIVEGHRQGSNVYYQVIDASIFALLEVARQIFDNRLVTLQEMADREPLRVSEAVDYTPD